MRRKKWVVASSDKDFAAQIAQELCVDPFAALLVTSRDFNNIDDIDAFFDADAPLSLDPMSIKDMDKAAERINRAIDDFELICVFGDYDADGVTATALLYSYLEARGANAIRYIPDRIAEGYGLNVGAIEELADRGVKLIVTVDNGVSAIEEAKRAKELGISLVVTDHHKVGDILPDAEAVVDPHREDCPSAFKEMSGVGVAFKLACALEGGADDMLIEEYGDLVALGTIGDVVTLKGENRTMVRRGLRLINDDPRPGIAALMEAAGVGDKYFTASSAAFTVCPRINAAGRMGSAHKALDLLLCDDEDTASLLADNGVEFILTGHMHIQSINEYVSENGNKIIDICTACLVGSPAKYRKISVDGNVMTVESIDTPEFRSNANGTELMDFFDRQFVYSIQNRILGALSGGKGAVKVLKSLGKKIVGNITVGGLGRLLWIKTDKSIRKIKFIDFAGNIGIAIFKGDMPFGAGTPEGDAVARVLKRFGFIIRKLEPRFSKNGVKVDLTDMLLNTISNNKGYSDNNAVMKLGNGGEK